MNTHAGSPGITRYQNNNADLIQIVCGAVVSVVSLGVWLSTYYWTSSSDVSGKFLGGLHWSPPSGGNHGAFNWHVLSMVTSVLCLSLSLLCKALENCSYTMQRLSSVKVIGIVLHFGMVVSLIFGIYAIYTSKNSDPSKHGDKGNWISLHSWLGLGFLAIISMYSLLTPLKQFISYTQHEVLLAYKSFLKDMAYLVGCITIETGLAEKNVHLSCIPSRVDEALPPGCKLSNFIGLMVLLLAAIVFFALRIAMSSMEPNTSIADRLPSIELEYRAMAVTPNKDVCLDERQPLLARTGR